MNSQATESTSGPVASGVACEHSSASHTQEKWGVFFTQSQHWEKSLAFRVDDKGRLGCKRFVCGACVEPDEADGSATTIGGSGLCEACNLPFGAPVCHDAAIAKALT